MDIKCDNTSTNNQNELDGLSSNIYDTNVSDIECDRNDQNCIVPREKRDIELASIDNKSNQCDITDEIDEFKPLMDTQSFVTYMNMIY